MKNNGERQSHEDREAQTLAERCEKRVEASEEAVPNEPRRRERSTTTREKLEART